MFKIIEPVLFPIVTDVLDILRFAARHRLKDCDILLNYNYQQIHFDLTLKYIDPGLLKECIRDVIWENNTHDYDITKEIQEKASESIYKKYYLFFYCKCLLEKGFIKDITEFWEWLTRPHDFTYEMSVKPNFITRLTRNYNSIVIPKLWEGKKMPIANYCNFVWGLTPNYFIQGEAIEKASKHLMGEGTIYLYSPKDWGKVMFSLGNEFDSTIPNIIPNEFKKRKTITKPKTKLRIWL